MWSRTSFLHYLTGPSVCLPSTCTPHPHSDKNTRYAKLFRFRTHIFRVPILSCVTIRLHGNSATELNLNCDQITIGLQLAPTDREQQVNWSRLRERAVNGDWGGCLSSSAIDTAINYISLTPVADSGATQNRDHVSVRLSVRLVYACIATNAP